MSHKIVCHSTEQHADSLAAYMPGGPLFKAKFITGTVIRRLVEGLAVQLGVGEDYLKLLQTEFIPDNTTLFLDEWESALGIPDDCFPQSTDPDERRQFILIKLASLGVQTVADFQALIELFGVDATVRPGSEAASALPFALPYPLPLVGSDARFTIVVEFNGPAPGAIPLPYALPFLLGANNETILSCLFQKLKPANCRVLFVEA